MLSLAVANYHTIYRDADVEAALAQLEATPHNAFLRKTYERMRSKGGNRFVVKPTSPDCLSELDLLCPNFKQVVLDLKKFVALSQVSSRPLVFMPILLLGDPGVGKTHFAKMLAKHLGTAYSFCSMATTSASWVLTGAAATWSGARYGKLAQTLIDEEYANPVIVLDEVDKSQQGNYDPMGALYQLLEHETAAHFKDEFLDVEFDTSPVLWVATANDVSRIPDPILSRMAVYEVPVPTPGEARVIAQNVYSALLAENGWPFQALLGDNVLEQLEAVLPRRMRKVLIDAFGNAQLKRRDYLTAEDLPLDSSVKRRMGF